MTNNEKLILFNVDQRNIDLCLEFSETAIRKKKVPSGIDVGSLCLLRQTSRGPDRYGVVGIYRIKEIEPVDPKKAIPGWTPSTSWTFKIHLIGEKLDRLFEEDCSKETEWLRIKESTKVKGLMNKDIQGEARVLPIEISINYLEAIENEK